MILCGIDSSSKRTGISFFKDNTLLYYDLIDLHTEKDSEIRLAKMIKYLYITLDKYTPDVIYQESTWVARNPQTVIQLTTIIGAVRGWCINNNSKWKGIAPNKWRYVLNLNVRNNERKVLKEKSITYVKDKFKIIPKTDDVADAICIGFAGCKLENIE